MSCVSWRWLSSCLIAVAVDFQSQPAAETSDKENPWTFVHSQFAIMGGFEILFANRELRKALPRALRARYKDENEPVHLTLTTDGLALLAERALKVIPDLTKDAIQDKSKGSAFAKTLVCLQGVSSFSLTSLSCLLYMHRLVKVHSHVLSLTCIFRVGKHAGSVFSALHVSVSTWA